MSASPSKSSEQYSSAQAIPSAVTVVAPAHHLEGTSESWSNYFNNHSNPSSFGRNPPPKRRCQDYDGNCSLVFSFVPYFKIFVAFFFRYSLNVSSKSRCSGMRCVPCCKRCRDALYCTGEITSSTASSLPVLWQLLDKNIRSFFTVFSVLDKYLNHWQSWCRLQCVCV